MRGRGISRREVGQDYPGALHELTAGEDAEFYVRKGVLEAHYDEGRTVFVWSVAEGWLPKSPR